MSLMLIKLIGSSNRVSIAVDYKIPHWKEYLWFFSILSIKVVAILSNDHPFVLFPWTISWYVTVEAPYPHL